VVSYTFAMSGIGLRSIYGLVTLTFWPQTSNCSASYTRPAPPSGQFLAFCWAFHSWLAANGTDRQTDRLRNAVC